MSILYTGIQPTGNIHLGNYLGAIKNSIVLQSQYNCIFSIADMHSITVKQNPTDLRESIKSTAIDLLACGVNPDNHILFNQSRIPQHAELAWIFNCVARVGWLNRMTQYKDKSGKNQENVSTGLYVYPNLMAADILLYKTTHVPIGEDQIQHLQLTKDIAIKFNNEYENYFTIPAPILSNNSVRIMSLKDASKKMSKSDPSDYSRINLIDSNDTIRNKIKKAKSDSLSIPDNIDDLNNRHELKNLMNIYTTLTGRHIDNTIGYFGGKTFHLFKQYLSDILINEIEPIRSRIEYYSKCVDYIDMVLNRGEIAAKTIAEKNIKEIKQIVGFI